MIYNTETVLGIADTLAADAAGNKQATMTDIDCAVSMLRSLAAERDNLKGIAEHRSLSIDRLLHIQGKQSTDIERLYLQRNQLLAALDRIAEWPEGAQAEIARAAISAANVGAA